MRASRTRTFFWSEETLAPLRGVVQELTEDAERRMPYVDDELRHRMMLRVHNLNTAVALMAEPAT